MKLKPKILIYDLETLPNQGYFFDIFSDRGIPLQFVVQAKSICTISYKWLGDTKTKVLIVDKPYDDKAILEAFMAVWVEADYTVAHYGDGFDYPFLAARLMANGLPPLPTVTTIDTYRLAKRHFGRSLNSNKLDHLASILKVGNKNKTDAMLWVKCAQGNKKAMKEMAAYNIQDVDLLEQVTIKLLAYFNSKLNMNLFKTTADVLCNACGSAHVQKRGTVVTKTTKKQRYQCGDCGHWQQGKLQNEKAEETKAPVKKPYRKSGSIIAPKNSTK